MLCVYARELVCADITLLARANADGLIFFWPLREETAGLVRAQQ